MTRKLVLIGMVLTVAALSAALIVAIAQQPPGGQQPGNAQQPGAQAQQPNVQGQQPGAQTQQPGVQGLPPRLQKQNKGNIEEMGNFIGVIDKMKGVCYSPEVAAMVAAGGLKDEVKRKPAEAAKDLEDLLANTKTIGLKTAIRMTLKDIYKEAGDDVKVVEQLKAIVQENDAEMQARLADRKKAIEAAELKK